MMDFSFPEDELAAIRNLIGARVLRIRTAHPWFEQIGWEGSRRCDLITDRGSVGLQASFVRLPHERAVGELAQLSVIKNADTTPWPLADHKGYARWTGPSPIEGHEIVGVRILSETVWLTDSDRELLRFTRQLGFFLITDTYDDSIEEEVDDDWLDIDGEDPFSNLYFGASARQNELYVDVRMHEATETRLGIHCFPGNAIIDIRLGETLHHRLTSEPL